MTVLLSGAALAADSRIRAENVAVVVNVANKNSVEICQYYLKARRIPQNNLKEVNIQGSPARLSHEQFLLLRGKIYSKINQDIQVVVLMWTAPYAVECNSITSALTLGVDHKQCQQLCAAGKPSVYFDSPVGLPTDSGLRLSMLLPTDSLETAKALIDRGVLSGFRVNEGDAYFLTTTDKARSSRSMFFPPSIEIPQNKLHIHNVQADHIENKANVMFYQTGMASVPKLETIDFLPGALADHLTSSGGDLRGSSQMSILKWIEAGATASYGTVSEPCNHWQKFPNSSVLLKHYLTGATAVEAYWKSVAWPAQGLFVGEPLAAPYCHSCSLDAWKEPGK
ncbi:MAG TPA: TIGR03790 family protein [Planctomycetaceae bacterium]|nr:TIGR03790 family protein [Planctomycetaceae bacterium]